MNEIKSSLKPLTLAKQVISEAADSFRDNSFATQTARLALTVLPRRVRHPLLGIAAQIAVPLLVRNVPKILHMIKGKEQGEASLATTRAGLLSGLRQAVSNCVIALSSLRDDSCLWKSQPGNYLPKALSTISFCSCSCFFRKTGCRRSRSRTAHAGPADTARWFTAR